MLDSGRTSLSGTSTGQEISGNSIADRIDFATPFMSIPFSNFSNGWTSWWCAGIQICILFHNLGERMCKFVDGSVDAERGIERRFSTCVAPLFFNPFTCVVGKRGYCEAPVCVVIFLLLVCPMTRQFCWHSCDASLCCDLLAPGLPHHRLVLLGLLWQE